MASGGKPRRKPRWGPAATSLGIHGLILAAVLTWTARPPLELFIPPPDPIPITLAPPRPPAEPAPADDPAPSPPARGTPRVAVRPPALPPPPTVAPLPATPAPPAPVVLATLSDAELAGARTAGAGGGGGAGAGTGGGQDCDMVRRLQDALGRDPEVRAAVAGARATSATAGRALLVWDGDWVQSPGQAGKGLAGVRQAIVMEVAFAPAACRAEPMRGLVVLTLDAPAGRLALGAGRWRWSDLLAARRG